MRFELLRQRVQRAERRVEGSIERAAAERSLLSQAWRKAWSPGRIVVAGLVSGFLVGRSEPLTRVGGARWLQLIGTVSSMLASLRAAAASEEANESADTAAREASAAADAASDAPAPPPHDAAYDPGAATRRPPARDAAEATVHAPAPAEAATELSER